MLKSYLQTLMEHPHLTKEEAETAMSIILDSAGPLQIAAFLTILKFRGEAPEEVAGMATVLQQRAVPVNLPRPVLDIVGTGGDLANTVNISTGSAILAAACGIPIAKHGNRSVSSQSGSADVLEEFGIDLECPPNQLEEYLKEAGIAFMYAPLYHPSLKKLAEIRKDLKLPTIINKLGPLLNPANAEFSLIGVADESTLELMSKVILQLNHKKRTLLFHGCGLDELTTLGIMKAYDIKDGEVTYFEIDPSTLGFAKGELKDLQGGNAQMNASILKEVFTGKKGAVADALILNAGAAVYIFGKASTLAEGVQVAREVLEKGGALKTLEKWVSLSKQLKLQRTQ
jgi:anthranilate phosphoribosyltransferase